MLCPKCTEMLVKVERQGVEIDYCPACHGLWLDRHELEKIIERSHSLMAPPAAEPPLRGAPRDYEAERRREAPYRERDHDDDDRYRDHNRDPRRRRRNWLEEIFDSFD